MVVILSASLGDICYRTVDLYSPRGREESDTTERLHFHFSLSCIGEGNATHSSVLAWRISGTAEPGGLPSMGSHRVRHDWSDLAAAAAAVDLLGLWLPSSVPRLENPMDGGAWWAAVLGVAKSQTQLSDFTFTFHFHALEKEMETHSSVLVWRILGMGEPAGLLSMGLHRVWSDFAAAAASPFLFHI